MPEEFLSKLSNREPVCYLRLGLDDLKLWNFDSSKIDSLNTHQLFTAAARPHFDYFFERVDFFGLSEPGDLSVASDEKFKQQLTAKSSAFTSPDEISAQVSEWVKEKKSKAVIITDGKSGVLPGFPNLPQITVRGRELFGNTEPVWLDLKKRLPKDVEIFFLALGSEKFLIGPRLKMRFNVPVVDIQMGLAKNISFLDKLRQFFK